MLTEEIRTGLSKFTKKAEGVEIGHEGHLLEEIDSYIVCHDCEKTLGRKCEVYSRVVGYLRPIQQWNPGKKEEFKDRVTYGTKVT